MNDLGIIGLGVMGSNLALNAADKGLAVAVWDRHPERTDAFLAEQASARLAGAHALEDFVRGLRRPRRILIMIKAGAPVDEMLGKLGPLLEPGDVVIDGGNELWSETERRQRQAGEAGIRFVGMGVSGGAEGARHGPSLMPGGERAAYVELAPVLEKLAAVADGPCVDYMGKGGAGHYVKMVHNGIEYADMQLLAEAYDLLSTVGGLGADELAETFATWNRGELEGFLVEITARIFRRRDEDTGRPLVDLVLDVGEMKGTGTWTAREALELGVAVPTIAAAVQARALSARKDERVAVARVLPGPPAPDVDRAALVGDLGHALYAAKIASYAQGMSLLAAASGARGFELDLARVVRVWKGGCIIRARLLGDLGRAFAARPDLPSLLLDEALAGELSRRQGAFRRVVGLAVQAGIATPALASALAYVDAYRRERLPANLTQAQRDLFGAHTYRRVDRPGTFHSDW